MAGLGNGSTYQRLQALGFRRIAIWLAGIVAFSAVGAMAQAGYFTWTPEIKNLPYDGRFTFARVTYETAPGGFYYGGMPAWAHGYPNAESHLMQIINAITYLNPHIDGSNAFAIEDPELFHYPVAFLTEAGFWVMSDEEADKLREYIEKGGFLIFDDFRNDRRNTGWPNFERNIRRVIPDAQIVDLTPDNPIFHSFFHIESFDIIPQYYDNGQIVFRGIYEDNDPHKRLVAVINFNTDTSHFWEFSRGTALAVDPSNEAYRLGVNYIMYGLTH